MPASSHLSSGGFTRSPSSGVCNPGTYRGVVEKIPYLRSLGVTAVELLPVFMFDEREGDLYLDMPAWGYHVFEVS